MKAFFTCFAICLLIGHLAFAQQATPVSKHTDIASSFYSSIKAEDADGFYRYCKLMILNTADSVSVLINEYGGENNMGLFKKEPLLSALKRIKKEEAALIHKARITLDWDWNIELCALFKSDQDFRKIPRDSYKDSVSKLENFVLIDSSHFVEFCDFVKKKGFPEMSNVGMKSTLARPLLKHFEGLVFFKDHRADFYIEKWKWLMPYVQKAYLSGSMDYGFYKLLVSEWLPKDLVSAGRTEDAAYFKKFEPGAQ